MLFFLPLGSNVPYSKQPYVCYAILICNVLVFLMNGVAPFHHPSIFVYAPHDSRFASTIFCAFLHQGFLHLLFNMLLFYIVGFNVESKMGSLRFALFFAIAASFSSLIHGIFDIRPLIGGSGAILAVMGAYLVIYTHASLRFNFLPLTFLVMIYYFIKPPVEDTIGWFNIPLSFYINLIVLFDLIFFGLLFRIPMTAKSWPLFLIYFIYNLRMGATVQSAGASTVSNWAHCGGFAFGAAFAVLFYGVSGLFRDIDGAVLSRAPKFMRKGIPLTSRAAKSRPLGSEGGIAFEENMDPRRLSIISQLQSAVFSHRPLSAIDLYCVGREDYANLLLAPNPQLHLGILLQEGAREDLAILAWEDLIAAYSTGDEAREARFLLARAYLNRPEDLELAQPHIVELRKFQLLKRDEVALNELERELVKRFERRGAGLDPSKAAGAATRERDPLEEFGEISELFDSVDQAWSVPATKAGQPPSKAVVSDAPPAQAELPPLKAVAPAKSAQPAKSAAPAKPSASERTTISDKAKMSAKPSPTQPKPLAKDLPEEVSKPPEHAPTQPLAKTPAIEDALPLIGACMVLVRPGSPLDFKVMVQTMAEFFELAPEEAERRLRRGKGILLKNVSAVEAKEFQQAIRENGQDALVVPVRRECQYEQPDNITTVQWSLDLCTCSTYSEQFPLPWAEIRMVSAALVKQQEMMYDVQRRVVDLFTKRPFKHFRLWDNMFNHRKSMLDEEPLLDASLDPLLPALLERAQAAIKTKSLLKAVNSEELLPHEFQTLAEYDNYNLWFLYTHVKKQ